MQDIPNLQRVAEGPHDFNPGTGEPAFDELMSSTDTENRIIDNVRAASFASGEPIPGAMSPDEYTEVAAEFASDANPDGSRTTADGMDVTLEGGVRMLEDDNILKTYRESQEGGRANRAVIGRKLRKKSRKKVNVKKSKKSKKSKSKKTKSKKTKKTKSKKTKKTKKVKNV